MKDYKEKTALELHQIKILSNIDKFLMNSACTSKIKEKAYLLKLLGFKVIVTTLLYRGSKHGWKAKDFHSRSDKKGPIISLYKIKDGDCVGGYSKAQFSSPSSFEWVVDSESLIFNLGQQQVFKSQGGEYGGIFCYSGRGPHYGYGELAACYEPFNGDDKCSSYANQSGYRIPKEDGKNKLTNKKD